MTDSSPPNLDRVFGVLADPTQRSIVARLATGDASVGEIARAYPVTLQAVIKHLEVPEGAALVTRTETRPHRRLQARCRAARARQ